MSASCGRWARATTAIPMPLARYWRFWSEKSEPFGMILSTLHVSIGARDWYCGTNLPGCLPLRSQDGRGSPCGRKVGCLAFAQAHRRLELLVIVIILIGIRIDPSESCSP